MSRLDRDRLTSLLVVALVAVVAFVGVHAAAVAAVTGGSQPMAAVSSVPTEPTAGAWSAAPTRTVSLSEQRMAVPFGGGSVDELAVQALSNESHVAFRLTWTDPTNDTSTGAPRAYTDAVAVMFHGGSAPPITMGSGDKPVNIWYWRANRAYGERQTGGDMYAYPHPDAETRPGAMAGNPLSQPDADGHNYYAEGFGSLTHAPAQPVHASAERTADGWSVVFTRERTADGQFDAAFEAGNTLYLAFAVWNGSAAEVNGQKSITLRFSTLDPGADAIATPAAGDGSDDDGGVADGGAPGDATPGFIEQLRSYRNPVHNAAILVAGCLLTLLVLARGVTRE